MLFFRAPGRAEPEPRYQRETAFPPSQKTYSATVPERVLDPKFPQVHVTLPLDKRLTVGSHRDVFGSRKSPRLIYARLVLGPFAEASSRKSSGDGATARRAVRTQKRTRKDCCDLTTFGSRSLQNTRNRCCLTRAVEVTAVARITAIQAGFTHPPGASKKGPSYCSGPAYPHAKGRHDHAVSHHSPARL
jgi:hypothetical protein